MTHRSFIQSGRKLTLGGPPLDAMIPVARRILGRKPLLLVAFDLDTAERCLKELLGEGLCVTIGLSDCEIPQDIGRWLERHCR